MYVNQFDTGTVGTSQQYYLSCQLHVAESKVANVYYPKDGSAVWCGQAAQSYEAVYGLYNLDSVGWQLHVAEFDGVKHAY